MNWCGARIVKIPPSLADEVEHIFPKAVYPDRVFDWENFLYACGPCNGPKSNHFSVLLHSSGAEIDVTPPHPSRRPADWAPTPPPNGRPLLINPREENPLHFLWLDIEGTFRLDPLSDLEEEERRRAVYTIDLLKLNKDVLLKARTNTYISIKAILRNLVHVAREKDCKAEVDGLLATLRSYTHKTVWFEMQRQRSFYPDIDVLLSETSSLFEQAQLG